MTRPNIIAFVYEDSKPEIFLRCLLFSTARRGNIIENMYVIFSQNNEKTMVQFLGIWRSSELG